MVGGVKMRKFFVVIMTVLMIFSMGITISAESLQLDSSHSNSISKYEVELAQSFSELGIDSKTQKKLIEKLKNGEMLDSMKEENITKELDKGLDVQLNEPRVITFPDGSKAITGAEIIDYDGDGDIGLTKHKTLAPGNYRIKTYWYAGYINAEYIARITIRAGRNNDYIRQIYDGHYTIIGGDVTSTSIKLERKYETSTDYAHSYYKVHYKLAGISATLTLNTYVGNDGYDTNLGTPKPAK